MVLGYRIKRLRKDKLLSQAQLGKLLGVSKVSVSGYESGNRVPSTDTLVKLVDVFNTSADFILGREINAVCEEDNNINILLSSQDISIIKELRENPNVYSKILEDPKRFLASISKKDI